MFKKKFANKKPERPAKGKSATKKELPAAVDDLTKGILYTSDFVHPVRRLTMAFGSGLLYGLGLVAAVAVIIPLAVWLLGRFDWVPLVGDFFVAISERIGEADGI